MKNKKNIVKFVKIDGVNGYDSEGHLSISISGNSAKKHNLRQGSYASYEVNDKNEVINILKISKKEYERKTNKQTKTL